MSVNYYLWTISLSFVNLYLQIMADVTANGEAKPQNGEAEKNESDSAKLHEQILKQVEVSQLLPNKL